MRALFFVFSLLVFSSCYYHHGDDEIEVSDVVLSTCDYLIFRDSLGNVPSEIFKVVEDMPQFFGCDSILNKAERRQCAEKLMNQFIEENLIYPQKAIQEKIEGIVVIQFDVETDGCLSNIRIAREIGGDCGKTAQEIVSQMPNWKSGRQRGTPVRVQFNLPVEFKL